MVHNIAIHLSRPFKRSVCPIVSLRPGDGVRSAIAVHYFEHTITKICCSVVVSFCMMR